MRTVVAIGLVALCATAHAGRHVVGRGETLERVAQVYGCSVGAVLRANRLTTTLVPAGTVIEIPPCSLRTRVHARRDDPDGRARRDDTGDRPRRDDPDDRARRALAAIDVADADREADDAPSVSVGEPWRGRLRGATRLASSEGYVVRRAERSYGAAHVVDHLRGAIAEVRTLYPELHPLAIGDLSARDGGRLADHHSHQSGLDVDIGFYFERVPDGYPDHFVAADDGELDLEATWALVVALSHSTDLRDGVQLIFLDRGVQARLYRWARARGTPDDQLAVLLQYPRTADAGLVRHWPHHADHLHVRFKPGR